MLNFGELARQPHVFQSLTGLSLTAFAQLLPTFDRAYETAQDAADAQRQTARQRARGSGCTAILAILADKLVFILFYFGMYPTPAAGQIGRV
jgi:hypothetical protein